MGGVVVVKARIPDLIIAMDVPDRAALCEGLRRLPPEADFFKIGLELFCAEGPTIFSAFRDRAARFFLDLKLHDIPRTVERAVRAAARWGVELLTVHASGGPAMIRAAAEAARTAATRPPRILAVTVLTSLDAEDLARLGLGQTPTDLALQWARLAWENGADGVVCSAREVAAMRKALGPDVRLVTPGIRPTGSDRGDQKRTATPEEAARNGADAIIVGRPILDAEDPAAAIRAIRADLARGAAQRTAH